MEVDKLRGGLGWDVVVAILWLHTHQRGDIALTAIAARCDVGILYLSQPPVERRLRLAIRQVMHKHDAIEVLEEEVSASSMFLRAANVAELDEEVLTFVILVQLHLAFAAHSVWGRQVPLLYLLRAQHMDQGCFADACLADN